MNVRKKKESKRIRHRRGVYNHGSAVISTRARLNKEWAGKKKNLFTADFGALWHFI